MQRPTLSLTTKIVLLVALMGVAFSLVTAYATWHIQRIENRYHNLLQIQVESANQASLVRHHVSRAAALLHTVVTTHDKGRVLHAMTQLTQMQQTFDVELKTLGTLLPEQDDPIQELANLSQHMFTKGQQIILSSAEGQNHQALQLLSQRFTPALDALHDALNAVRANAHQAFAQSAQELEAQTQKTIRIALLASWCCALLVSGFAAWVALRFISRPITRLTQSMQRMQSQQYEIPIRDQERRDEIGSMARTLQQFGRELQEAKEIEQELAQHQKNQYMVEHLQQLTSALPGAVFQMELSPKQPLRLRFVSPQWIQLMGLPEGSATDLATAASTIRYHDDQVTLVSEKHFAQSAQTLEPVDFEVPMVMRDGVTRWIKTRANPLRQDDGSIIFNGVWLDVTKENQQAQALKKAKSQAEQDAQARSILQASISHEIRTPLNAILGLTQLILKADLPPPQREQLQNVLSASQHLRGIVNEVLDFSKIDAGQLKLESTDFSLANVVLDVVRMCQEEVSKKNLTLTYQIAQEIPDHLRGDPHRIAQILLNYVNNGIKFTASGKIHVQMQLAPGSTLHRVVLRGSVTDTGPGIPADRIPLLFEAYQQADNSITRRFGGTGLGLTISRALAQLMGGTAGVDSTLGQGSTFWFTAVLEPARTTIATTTAPEFSAPIAKKGGQGMRVLVVDDNPLNRTVAEGMLRTLGLHTETAEDGVQALFKLQAAGPDYYQCVLMDIQMPHMDGISATQALRKLPGFADLPVIAMTAHTGLHDVERTKQAGMNAHLSKPLLESTLHHLLQQYLGKDSGQEAGIAAPILSKNKQPEIPATFDYAAVDALAQIFDMHKLHDLVTQFSHDSQQRSHALRTLAQQQEWSSMRAEAHKLSGTAATFGLLQLGYWSHSLSAALKANDTQRISELVESIVCATDTGVQELQAYVSTLGRT